MLIKISGNSLDTKKSSIEWKEKSMTLDILRGEKLYTKKDDD